MITVTNSICMITLCNSYTVQYTDDNINHHHKAVKRGTPNTFVVVDMPFMSYHISLAESLTNARKIFQETNAQALKVEGASPEVLALTKHLTEAGIPVIAHLGLTPQTVNVLGGYKVQGKGNETGTKLLQDAKEIEDQGAIGLVLECIPKELAQMVTNALQVPTIGIGAGVNCDGQVLVYHDILKYGRSEERRVGKSVDHGGGRRR